MTGSASRRVVHYYRRAFDAPSGVTTAIAWWARLALDCGWDALVVGEPGSHSNDYACAVTQRHLGTRRRQTSAPVGLGSLLRPGDILYIHEGWVTSNFVAARAARAAGAPVVAMPHGVYEPQLVKRLRGRHVRRRLEAAHLARVSAIHLFYEGERAAVDGFRAQDVAIIPTGYEHPDIEWVGGGGYVGWYGRYDVEHKGLDVLLRSLSRVAPGKRPQLVLRGIDYQGGQEVVGGLVRSLGLEGVVTVGGPVFGAEKWEFLRRAVAFVHPARWDAQGISVIEALGVGVPLILSSGTRMSPDLHSQGAAIVVRDEAELAAALEAPPSPDVGLRGRQYVQSSLSRTRLTADYARFLTRTGA